MGDFVAGLMPKPLDDLAAAWCYIKEHEETFGVKAENYVAGGFSAGGHLTAMWGTPNRGARSYGIPNPRLLLLGYPVVTLENMAGETARVVRAGLFGQTHTQETVREYGASSHVDENYPAVFLVQAVDDDTVPIEQSYIMERPAVGGHGFGLGSATPAKDWPERALGMLGG